MKGINKIFNFLKWLLDYILAPNPNYDKYGNSINSDDETTINPSTGLPMIGGLDSMGNSYGSSASDREHYHHNDYHQSSISNSSYDPFNNRYQ